MDYNEYLRQARQAAELVESGDYPAALDILRGLLASDISSRDKAMMCVNMAVVHDKLGQQGEALNWYDKGIFYEGQQGGVFVAESKAVYLAEHGRVPESIMAYKEILARNELDEGARERIRQNIAKLDERKG